MTAEGGRSEKVSRSGGAFDTERVREEEEVEKEKNKRSRKEERK